MARHWIALALTLASGACARGAGPERWAATVADREAYREALDGVRKTHGGSYKLPAVDFYLFGMGPRDKFVYSGGRLRDAVTGKVVREWDVAEEVIAPAEYTVAVRTKDGKFAFVWEDERAVWVEADGVKEALSKGAVKLPGFEGRKHRRVLRVLHQEMLVNVLDGKPLPNGFVYSKPWYRDAAMMAMAFEKTGNLPAVKDWILGLREPFDRN